MLVRVWIATLGLFLFLVPRAARAADTQGGGERRFLDAPPPIADQLPPAPTREADEHARKTWEFIPSGGISAPFCRGDNLGLGRCSATESGVTLGASVLYRVTPYIAMGLDAALTQFTQRRDDDRYARAFSQTSWVGFVVRGYFLETGAFDPYVETGFGRGSVSAGYHDGVTAVHTEAAAPTVMAGAGVDFWLGSFLRVGPSVVYRWSWLTNVHACSGAWCEDVDVAQQSAIGSYATFALRATIALGREM